MRLFYADEIVHWTEDEIWAHEHDKEKVRLDFFDGEIETDWGQIIISWYFWECFRDYPLASVSVRHFLHDEYDSPGLEGKILNRVKEEIISVYPNENLENIQAAIYRGNNRQHNAMTTRGEKYADFVDALTLLEIYEHPEIEAANRDMEATSAGINRAYGVISRVIDKDPVLRHNSIGAACHMGQTKMAQFHQVVGKRGLCSEVDQTIFPHVVNAGFFEGIHRPSFFAMISRDAAKALQATDDPVKQTEYYNRELQLFTYIIKEIEMGDCGSTETIPWLVKKGELDNILPGKFYVDPVKGLTAIKAGDDHLVGKEIQLRNVACCWHPKDGTICSTCMGQIGRSVQKGTNLGHAATVTQNEKVSQDVISTKHLLRSAETEGFEIDDFYKDWMVNASDISELMLSEKIWNHHVEVEIDMAYLPRLSDIHALSTFRPQDLMRISGVEDILLIVHQDDENKTVTEELVSTSHSSYRPYLTEAFIKHMKDYGFQNLGKKIRVDLMHWDPSESILKFPERHSSTLEMMLELKSNIFMSSKESKERLRYDLTDPDILSMALKDITAMTNRKFSVNLAIVEIVLFAMMSRDPKNNDYRLPKKGTGRRFATKSELMSGRSLSMKCAYEKQYQSILSPLSYDPIKESLPFDHLLLDVTKYQSAQDILKEKKRR